MYVIRSIFGISMAKISLKTIIKTRKMKQYKFNLNSNIKYNLFPNRLRRFFLEYFLTNNLSFLKLADQSG